MAYITEQDLVSRFGQREIQQLSDRSNMGTIDSAVVSTAINDASAEIDTYLAGKYALPLASNPVVLISVAANIARYHLYDLRATEIVQARYDDAIKFLKAISNGTASLGLDSSNTNVESSSAGVKSSIPSRVFNDSSLAGY